MPRGSLTLGIKKAKDCDARNIGYQRYGNELERSKGWLSASSRGLTRSTAEVLAKQHLLCSLRSVTIACRLRRSHGYRACSLPKTLCQQCHCNNASILTAIDGLLQTRWIPYEVSIFLSPHFDLTKYLTSKGRIEIGHIHSN